MELAIKQAEVITSQELFRHWMGHRQLTRRVIEAFPEKDFFSFSIGGMRTPALLVSELLAIAGPGLQQIVEGKTEELQENVDFKNSKATALALWDEADNQIKKYWSKITNERFHDRIVTFGQYEGSIWSSIFYFIDNEIHHRAQLYVYLRALGVEPPAFWDRDFGDK
ncbi:MAG: damage-inducible protein DinB [Cyclobacteriaceae bacterium]|nr:MAG: damage-inducible protein DinB [Cyclobacteriaceae bacterium]